MRPKPRFHQPCVWRIKTPPTMVTAFAPFFSVERRDEPICSK
jgi:hypothetical protein